MKGAQLNEISKVLNVLETEYFNLDSKIVTVDLSHVSMFKIEAKNGDVLGKTADIAIDPSDLKVMRFDANEDYDLVLSPAVNRLHFYSDTAEYTIPFEKKGRTIKEPVFDNHVRFDIQSKDLRKALYQCSRTGDDNIMFYTNIEGDVFIRSKNNDYIVDKKIGTSDFPREVRAMYPIDYIKRIVNATRGNVSVSFYDDNPLTVMWEDIWNRYTVHTAPRIER